MLVKYIDSNYIIEKLQKPSWGEVEEPDFYITMASNRVKALIFPSEQGNPNDINSYTEEQQEAIKLATAIYTLWYFDTNYDFTSGSVSVNFGGASMSESKTYNGEMVLPNVFDILKQANLIPTTETFIFNNVMAGDLIGDGINPKAFKDLQQEVERQADQNIKQDAKIVDIYDKLEATGSLDVAEIKEDIEAIKEEQVEQNKAIETNANEIETVKTDLGDLGDQVIDVQNKANENTTNITANTTQIQANTDALNNKVDLTTAQTITGAKIINKLVLADKVFFGPENDPDYTYDRQYRVLHKTNNLDILDDEELVPKSYVDNLIAPLQEYAKTGIIQMVIWNQNGYKIRLIPILTPPSLVGKENEFFDRIHISTTTYKQNNSAEPTIFNEFEGGEYVEILKPQTNIDIEVRSLNTNNFRDNNRSMNLYSWWDMNQNLITGLNGEWSPKIIIPITSRYDRNGQVLYLVYKAVR